MIVLITGAAQGIGRAIAEGLAWAGNTLIIADLQEQKLEEAKSQLEHKCENIITFSGDLTEEQTRRKLVTQIKEEFGTLDVLINNAGITHDMKPLEDLSDAEYERVFSVNLKLPFQLMRDLLPTIKHSEKGWVINICSTANIGGHEQQAIYAATKAALASLTGSIAKESEGMTNIKAISVVPSSTDTELNAKLRGKSESAHTQSPQAVADVITMILNGQLEINSGDDVRIRGGKYIVEKYIGEKNFSD